MAQAGKFDLLNCFLTRSSAAHEDFGDGHLVVGNVSVEKDRAGFHLYGDVARALGEEAGDMPEFGDGGLDGEGVEAERARRFNLPLVADERNDHSIISLNGEVAVRQGWTVCARNYTT